MALLARILRDEGALGVSYEATRGDYTHARKAVVLAQCPAVPISDVRWLGSSPDER